MHGDRHIVGSSEITRRGNGCGESHGTSFNAVMKVKSETCCSSFRYLANSFSLERRKIVLRIRKKHQNCENPLAANYFVAQIISATKIGGEKSEGELVSRN